MLISQLPDHDRGLIGSGRILEHLHRLGVRRRNGTPLAWRIVLRWRSNLAFPLLRGFQHGHSRSPSFTTEHAVAAWILSRFTTNSGCPFTVGTYGVMASQGSAPHDSGAVSGPRRAA